jgi:alpha-galactosidase
LLSSPLLIGCDMSRLDNFTLGLLTNDEVLAVDQDALARPAKKVWDKDNIQVWVKELKDGSKAVGIFNLGEQPAKPTIPYSSLGFPAQLKVRDLWRQKDLTSVDKAFAPRIPAHGVVLLKVKAKT